MRLVFKTLILISILFSRQDILAQTTVVSGKVSGTDGGLTAATISLLNAKDSSWVKSELADEKGDFTFNEVRYGNYLLSASSIGYKAGLQAIDVSGNRTDKFSIKLEKENTTLGEVAITAKKPFMEMSLGKTIVNIEGTTTTAGNNALDLLRRLPGISLDQNETISMRGKEGVLVLINDRPTYLEGDDLAAYLKTLTADDIAQLELITQPGAKYDAAGNTGVINIKTRRNRKQGWNGSLTAMYGIGVYFHRDESFLLNYKRNKLNLSLNASDVEAIGFADWRETRSFTDAATGLVTGTSKVTSNPRERFSTTALRLGVDYDLTERTSVGVNARGSYHPNISRYNLHVANSDLVNNLNTYNNAVSTDGHIRKDVTTNVYVSHKFSKESTLDINADYLRFGKNATQDVTTTTLDDQMVQLLTPRIVNSQQLSDISVYSIKADYNYTINEGLKMEGGIKSSKVTTDNNALFRIDNNSVWANDTNNTNRFVYKEQINTAYVTLAKELNKKWEAKVGIRAEQTISEGLQYIHNQHFNRNYISLFPTAYVTYKRDSNNQFELNYGRRIDRPGYKELNPFIYYSFQFTAWTGNPDLRPQYSDNIELKHSYKNRLISTIGFSSTTNVFVDMLGTKGSSQILYSMDRNAGTRRMAYYSAEYNKDLFKWWTLNAGGSVFTSNAGGPVNGIYKKVDWSGYSVNMNSQFAFGKRWKAEVYGFYNSKGLYWLTSGFAANFNVEMGLSKKVNDHILVRFFTADPFNTYRFNIHSGDATFRSESRFRYASQLYSLSFTYSFGGGKNAVHKNNALDEAGRIR